MTEAEAIEAARHFIWNRTESHPVYPLDDEGHVDERAVSDGEYDWNILEDFQIAIAEVIKDAVVDDDCYTVEISGSVTWSQNEGPENFTFHVYVPLDADAEQSDFDFDLVA